MLYPYKISAHIVATGYHSFFVNIGSGNDWSPG